MRREGFSLELAERFVRVAGRDLMESWEWHASVLDLEDLASWPNAQRLLGGIHTDSVARDLDMEPPDVWRALRTFVPKVLILLSRVETRASRRASSEATTSLERRHHHDSFRSVSSV
ncbi:MAG: hypothetical protein R3304_05070 [Longimicrobiales bacterium]|nr:hypothetical protein [Longimicrobiales bacterium]